MRRFAVLLLIVVALLSIASQAQTCPANQTDMLTSMLPWQGLQNGHYDVIYPRSGTFYWVKGVQGWPWDVDLFDGAYIYQSITEQVWNQPTTFKRFVHRRIGQGLATRVVRSQLEAKKGSKVDATKVALPKMHAVPELELALGAIWEDVG